MNNFKREIGDLAKQAKWKLVRHSNGHAIYRCPCGKHTTSVSATPSDQNAVKNVRTQLRQCPQSRDILGPVSHDKTRPPKPKPSTDIDKTVIAEKEKETDMAETPDKVMFGLARLAAEIVADRFQPGEIFTTNDLAGDSRFTDFLVERLGDDGKDGRTIRIYAQRSLRNLTVSKRVESVSRRRDGESEYRLMAKESEPEMPADYYAAINPEPVVGKSHSDFVQDRLIDARQEARKSLDEIEAKREQRSDMAALKVGDSLEIIALIGNSPIVRDEIGQLYALRPVELKVL